VKAKILFLKNGFFRKRKKNKMEVAKIKRIGEILAQIQEKFKFKKKASIGFIYLDLF